MSYRTQIIPDNPDKGTSRRVIQHSNKAEKLNKFILFFKPYNLSEEELNHKIAIFFKS